MSPFRTEVLVAGFVLAIPVLALGLRGDLSAHEVVTRLLWCLAAGWAAMAVLRAATRPPASRPAPPSHPSGTPPNGPAAAEPTPEDAAPAV